MSLDWALICIVMSQSTCNKIVLKCMGINNSYPLSATEINYMYAFQQLDEGFTIVRLVSSYVTSRETHVKCCCISDCEYDMQTYRHMESFLASYDPCLNCSCTNSIVRCIPIMCPHRDFPCRNPIRKGKGCCEFVCPSE